MDTPRNSKITRVQPVVTWLRSNAGDSWPARLVAMSQGVASLDRCGSILNIWLDPERKVSATPARLKWMIEHVDALAPQDGRRWRVLHNRLANGEKERALALLGADKPLPPKLIFEGPTHVDCLIECEHAFIWIEGKRFDWLSPCTSWDVTRDQLARNVEATWSLARCGSKEYRLLICHEHALKYHEQLLLDGYRTGTWTAGWPDIHQNTRREFSKRIGTLTWNDIVQAWPAMKALAELQDLVPV